MIASDCEKLLTPPAVAKKLGVTPERVINWIKAGKLRAFNFSEGKKRPRFRVSPDDLDAFLASREVATNPRPRRRKKRRNYEFY